MKYSAYAAAIAGALVLCSNPLAAADALVAPAAPAPAAADDVVAKGKGFEIKRSLLDEEYRRVEARAAANGQPIPPEQGKRIQADLLDRIVSTKLLAARANDGDKAKAKEAAEKYLADTKKQMPSEEMFNLQLKAAGLTMETFMARLSEQTLCEEVINREVRSAVKVPEDASKKFYDDNIDMFKEKEQVRAAHVLIGTKDKNDTNPNPGAKKDLPDAQKAEKKKLAESIRERAIKGEDFAKLAKEFSEDPGSKDTGGEYTFPRGQMVPEFEAAAFSLEVGKVSEVVTTTYGYHVIKLLEKMPAKTVEFAKVNESIKRRLENQELQKSMPDYLQKLRKESEVTILDESLKPAPEPAAPAPAAPAPAGGKK